MKTIVYCRKFRIPFFVIVGLSLPLTLWAIATRQNKPPSPAPLASSRQINLAEAIKVKLPPLAAELQPQRFHTPDGQAGWALQIPGHRPIATPAYANGVLFVGGGYGSHEFYAFEAATGKVKWQIKTSDDGPSAAVVEDGCVAFNTESCTVIVVAADTGKLLWQEWLGDPLMSQPAIAEGKLFIAYPAGQRGQKASHLSPTRKLPAQGHRLLCADLKTGRHLWEQAITADVISAPVVEGKQLFFTCFDGTSFCLNVADGAIVWQKQNAATSAPVIAEGQLLVTMKEARTGQEYEGLKRLDAQQGHERDKKLLAAGKAEYLAKSKGGGGALSVQAQETLDASVGFGGGAPAAANLSAAAKNVGVATVAGGWAYQGSRAALSRGQVLNAQGRFINALAARTGAETWRAEIVGEGLTASQQVFTPPALGAVNLYLCGLQGYVLSLRQQDGKLNFAYHFETQIAFQPALAKGSLYFGTVDGKLICLTPQAPDADGWYAWGGNAQHNKKW